MATVIDYAGGVPSASAIKKAGHIGVVRYISPDRTGGSLPGKPISLAEKKDLENHGLKIAYVWQYGKTHDADVRRGRSGGIEDAKKAQAHLDKIGASEAPVFFAVDYDITIQEWNSFGAEYFRGAASVIGKERVGIYGHSRVCHWAGPEDGVVAQVSPGIYLCWVTKGYSRGADGKGYSVLYQRVVDTKSNPGPRVGGVTVDINDVYHEDWGWRPLKKRSEETPKPNIKVRDVAVDIDESHKIAFGRPTQGNKKIIILHTTENTLGTPASNIIDYQVRKRNGSYHRLVDLFNGKGRITLANTDNWQTWSTGNILNDIALHVSIVWWAKTTRPEWLSQPEILKAVARVFAYWSRTYGIQLRKLTREQLGRKESGVAGHLEAQVFGGTDHWDPGYHFPYDVVLEMARQINSAPQEVVQAEQDFMEVFMSNKIRSLINPSKEFSAENALALVDAQGWRGNIADEFLFEALGIDYDAAMEAAIQANIKGEPRPSVTKFIK